MNWSAQTSVESNESGDSTPTTAIKTRHML